MKQCILASEIIIRVPLPINKTDRAPVLRLRSWPTPLTRQWPLRGRPKRRRGVGSLRSRRRRHRPSVIFLLLGARRPMGTWRDWFVIVVVCGAAHAHGRSRSANRLPSVGWFAIKALPQICCILRRMRRVWRVLRRYLIEVAGRYRRCPRRRSSMSSRRRHVGIHLWRGEGPYWERAGHAVLMPPHVGNGGPRGLTSIVGLWTVIPTGALTGHGWLLDSIESGVIGFYAAR
jgi:hypothetical protein